MRDIDGLPELVAALRSQLAAEPAGSTHRDTIRGQLDGASANGPLGAPVAGDEDVPAYRGGYVAGMLYAEVLRATGRLSADELLGVAAYGAALSVEWTSSALDHSDQVGVLKAHSIAAFRAAKRGALSAPLELILFRWLCRQRSLDVSPELLARYETWRDRRLTRTSGGGIR